MKRAQFCLLAISFFSFAIIAAQTAAEVNQYDPVDSTTLVFNKKEFSADLTGFSNYKGWKTKKSVLHNAAPRAIRKATACRFLVLHESGGPDHGFGFNPPLTAHFSVLRNGNILQFNDMAEIQYHAFQFNNEGIGIEFVNESWITGKGIPSKETALTAAQKTMYAEDKGYLWTFWGDGYNICRLPGVDQLEQLNSLVKRLIRKLEEGFPSINTEWLQLVSYNDISNVWVFRNEADIPATEAGKAVKNYFIFSSGYNYMDPARFQSFESGILSHASINNIKNGYVDEDGHPDGSLQSLYCLLRRRMDEEVAFEKAKDLMKNKMIVARTKATVKWFEGKGADRVEKTGYRNIYLLDLGDL